MTADRQSYTQHIDDIKKYIHDNAGEALNRGVLLTPFHNMALMSPSTSDADVDRALAAGADRLRARRLPEPARRDWRGRSRTRARRTTARPRGRG